MTAELAPYFFQVAYVVPDLAAAEAWFRRTMGVRQFTRMDRVELGAGCRHRGRSSKAALALSLGWLGDTQLELVRPLDGDSIHAEFLAAGRTGLHHVAYAVPDFAAAAAGLAAQGLAPVADGVLDTGMRVEFAYYDCTGDGASFVELLGFDAAARAFMDGLKVASRKDAR